MSNEKPTVNVNYNNSSYKRDYQFNKPPLANIPYEYHSPAYSPNNYFRPPRLAQRANQLQTRKKNKNKRNKNPNPLMMTLENAFESPNSINTSNSLEMNTPNNKNNNNRKNNNNSKNNNTKNNNTKNNNTKNNNTKNNNRTNKPTINVNAEPTRPFKPIIPQNATRKATAESPLNFFGLSQDFYNRYFGVTNNYSNDEYNGTNSYFPLRRNNSPAYGGSKKTRKNRRKNRRS
jgi:hypothetical protein